MGERTSLVFGSPELRRMMSYDEPRPLPYSAYPRARDVAQHGVQPLPASLPLVDFARAAPHRSTRYSTVVAADLIPAQLLQMAWVIAASFARREPQARHLRPPQHPPAGLMEARHSDPFGTDSFVGHRDATVLANTSHRPDRPHQSAGRHRGQRGGTGANPCHLGRGWTRHRRRVQRDDAPFDMEPPLREDDPFLDTVVAVWEPVYAALGAQDAEALTALSERCPAFREAYAQGKVGHHLLVARSDDLPKGDAFELVAASAEHYRALGFTYMVTEATNQWTGAAFEALGGVRVHFAPFQARPFARAPSRSRAS
jgi:hypothetical protein